MDQDEQVIEEILVESESDDTDAEFAEPELERNEI